MVRARSVLGTVVMVAMFCQAHAAHMAECRGFSQPSSGALVAEFEAAELLRARTRFVESRADILPFNMEPRPPSANGFNGDRYIGLPREIEDAFPGVIEGHLVAHSDSGFRALAWLDLVTKGRPSEFGAYRFVLIQILPVGSDSAVVESAAIGLVHIWRAAVRASRNPLLMDYFRGSDPAPTDLYEMMHLEHEGPRGFTVALDMPIEAGSMSIAEFDRLISTLARGGLRAIH